MALAFLALYICSVLKLPSYSNDLQRDHTQHPVHSFWCVVLQLILPGYNARYFGKQATANYAVHYMLKLLGQDELMKAHIEQRTSVTTGTEIMAWKDALGVPQRGS